MGYTPNQSYEGTPAMPAYERQIPGMQCPEDNAAPHATLGFGTFVPSKRSYAMNFGGQNVANTSANEALGVSYLNTNNNNPYFRMIRQSEVTHPSDTLMTVERPGWYNWSGHFATPAAVVLHDQYSGTPAGTGPQTTHGSVWNYLFVDIHVGTMDGIDTVAPGMDYDSWPATGRWVRKKQ